MAKASGADVINFEEVRVNEALTEMTGGRGPDHCIDCVGLEAHGWAIDNVLDFVKTTLKLSFDRPHVLREAILACKPGGTLSIPGVYGGFLDKVPFGAAFGKGLTMKMGQTNMHKYLAPLLGAHPQGRDRPQLHHQPPAGPGGRPRRLQELPRRPERMDQGGPATQLSGAGR